MQHENNAAGNLGGVTRKGFLPGQSANPSGRRKGCASLTANLKRKMSRADANAIARKLIDLAKSGDLPAMRLLFERMDTADIERRLVNLEINLAKFL